MAPRPMTLEMATGIGTDFVRRSGNAKIAEEGAEWRAREPTDSQKKAAEAWRIEAPRGMKRGELSDLLTTRIGAVDLLRVGLCEEVWGF